MKIPARRQKAEAQRLRSGNAGLSDFSEGPAFCVQEIHKKNTLYDQKIQIGFSPGFSGISFLERDVFMKLLRMLLIASLSAMASLFLLAGCGAAQESAPQEPVQEVEEPAEGESQVVVEVPAETAPETAEAPSETEEAEAFQPVYVADAAMYRGTVLSVEPQEDGSTLVHLQKAEGTRYTQNEMVFRFQADTPLSFAMEDLTEGRYLEVFYGASSETDAAADQGEVLDALGANLYFETAMVNFNGTFQEWTPSDGSTGSIGSLTMTDLSTGETVIFHCSDSTQMRLNVEELQPGDKLNIFHQGVYTRSLPPQGSALEVAKYAE